MLLRLWNSDWLYDVCSPRCHHLCLLEYFMETLHLYHYNGILGCFRLPQWLRHFKIPQILWHNRLDIINDDLCIVLTFVCRRSPTSRNVFCPYWKASLTLQFHGGDFPYNWLVPSTFNYVLLWRIQRIPRKGYSSCRKDWQSEKTYPRLTIIYEHLFANSSVWLRAVLSYLLWA